MIKYFLFLKEDNGIWDLKSHLLPKVFIISVIVYLIWKIIGDILFSVIKKYVFQKFLISFVLLNEIAY